MQFGAVVKNIEHVITHVNSITMNIIMKCTRKFALKRVRIQSKNIFNSFLYKKGNY